MSMTVKNLYALCALLSALAILLSCSAAPPALQIGTPAFYWQAAREAYAAGDYMTTLAHLDHLIAGNNEYTARALPWSLVLSSGMAAGYTDLAENYAIGARANKSDPGTYRGLVSKYRGFASRLDLQFAEDYTKLAGLKDASIPLAFGYPKGSAAQPPVLTKVVNGLMIQALEVENVEKRGIERGILLAASRATGSIEDTAKAADLLKKPDASVPRATFMMAMAETLYNASQLYSRDKLDDPQKVEILCQRAEDALQGVPESKQTKALGTRIQAALKKAKKA